MRAALLVLLVTGCSSPPSRAGDDVSAGDDAGAGDAPGADTDAPIVSGAGTNVFAPTTTNVRVEIDYEHGRAPFTGPILGWGDTFDTTKANVDRLFAGTRELAIPSAIADMEDIGTIADEELTVADLVAIAAAHRDRFDTPDTKTYYVVFVSGKFVGDNGPSGATLGVSLGTSGIIAMFRDAIDGTNVIGVPNVVRYVEQSTLVHELAHAVGLVANGIAMVHSHRDAAHGNHCNNDACVMYWSNDGAGDAAAYAQQRLLANDTILFDANCLADVDALTGEP